MPRCREPEEEGARLAAADLRALRRHVLPILRKRRLRGIRGDLEKSKAERPKGVHRRAIEALRSVGAYDEARLTEALFETARKSYATHDPNDAPPELIESDGISDIFAAHRRSEPGSRRQKPPPWAGIFPSVVAEAVPNHDEYEIVKVTEDGEVVLRPTRGGFTLPVVKRLLGKAGHRPRDRMLAGRIRRVHQVRREIEDEQGGVWEVGTTRLAQRDVGSAVRSLESLLIQTNARDYIRRAALALALRDLGVSRRDVKRLLGNNIPTMDTIH